MCVPVRFDLPGHLVSQHGFDSTEGWQVWYLLTRHNQDHNLWVNPHYPAPHWRTGWSDVKEEESLPGAGRYADPRTALDDDEYKEEVE